LARTQNEKGREKRPTAYPVKNCLSRARMTVAVVDSRKCVRDPTQSSVKIQSNRVGSRHGKIALFIDGANTLATAKALGFDIDFKRLLLEFRSWGMLVRAFFYTTVVEENKLSTVRPLLDWLDYNGFAVMTKPTMEFVDASRHRKLKGNIDIELAVDAMELADHVDQIVLFSGDGSFRSLVEALQRRGVRVTVVSSIAIQPPMIASELRRQADAFVDLRDLKSKVGLP
jgi:uncharacterized LabA/DUF88 family protein